MSRLRIYDDTHPESPLLDTQDGAIIAALHGLGVWSLVLSSLISNTVIAAALWMFCPWRPKLLLDWGEVRSAIRNKMFASAIMVVIPHTPHRCFHGSHPPRSRMATNSS